MGKPRLLVVGGKRFNIPSRLLDYFEIAKHIEQDQTKFTVRSADYILVIANWVDHKAIQLVKAMMPGVPVIQTRKGWNSMRLEFIRRGLLPPTVL